MKNKLLFASLVAMFAIDQANAAWPWQNKSATPAQSVNVGGFQAQYRAKPLKQQMAPNTMSIQAAAQHSKMNPSVGMATNMKCQAGYRRPMFGKPNVSGLMNALKGCDPHTIVNYLGSVVKAFPQYTDATLLRVIIPSYNDRIRRVNQMITTANQKAQAAAQAKAQQQANQFNQFSSAAGAMDPNAGFDPNNPQMGGDPMMGGDQFGGDMGGMPPGGDQFGGDMPPMDDMGGDLPPF